MVFSLNSHDKTKSRQKTQHDTELILLQNCKRLIQITFLTTRLPFAAHTVDPSSFKAHECHWVSFQNGDNHLFSKETDDSYHQLTVDFPILKSKWTTTTGAPQSQLSAMTCRWPYCWIKSPDENGAWRRSLQIPSGDQSDVEQLCEGPVSERLNRQMCTKRLRLDF